MSSADKTLAVLSWCRNILLSCHTFLGNVHGQTLRSDEEAPSWARAALAPSRLQPLRVTFLDVKGVDLL